MVVGHGAVELREKGYGVEVRKERCEIVALILWTAEWCCGGKDGRT